MREARFGRDGVLERPYAPIIEAVQPVIEPPFNDCTTNSAHDVDRVLRQIYRRLIFEKKTKHVIVGRDEGETAT